MTKISLTLLLIISIAQTGFSQNKEIGDSGEGRYFMKSIENNCLNNAVIVSNGKKSKIYNVKSKTSTEKLFFGNTNAMVEFFINSSPEGRNGPYGFRLVKDSSETSCILELKRFRNWEALNSIPDSKPHKKSQEHYDAETGVITNAFPVKNVLAEKLYGTISFAIKNFVMKGDNADIFDGSEVTFRCVVGDEVWTLTIQEPDGEIGQLIEICQQLATDMQSNILDESKYEKLLDSQKR